MKDQVRLKVCVNLKQFYFTATRCNYFSPQHSQRRCSIQNILIREHNFSKYSSQQYELTEIIFGLLKTALLGLFLTACAP